MEPSIVIYRGTSPLCDGANALLNGFLLTQAEHALDVFARARATQMAVQDRVTKATAVSLQITRQFATDAEAKDHAQRAPQTGTGQHDLVITLDDGSDVHTWTLSDMDGGGAAWKSARALSCIGVCTVVEYTIAGGIWVYDGPLDSTYSDAIPDAAFNSALCNALNCVLARVTLGASETIELPSRSFAGTLRYGGATLAGALKNQSNPALTGFSAPLLTSLAGTLNLTSGTAITAFSAPLLATLTGTLNCTGCTALASVTLPVSIATANGFYCSFSNCALSTATVDAILAAFAAGLGATSTGSLILSGVSNGSPTGGSGNAGYLALTGAGITVYIH